MNQYLIGGGQSQKLKLFSLWVHDHMSDVTKCFWYSKWPCQRSSLLNPYTNQYSNCMWVCLHKSQHWSHSNKVWLSKQNIRWYTWVLGPFGCDITFGMMYLYCIVHCIRMASTTPLAYPILYIQQWYMWTGCDNNKPWIVWLLRQHRILNNEYTGNFLRKCLIHTSKTNGVHLYHASF